MFDLVLLGAGFAFAAAVQPGPLQAFLLSRVLAHGWRHTLPAALSPVLSDGPIALLVLLVLGTMPGGAQRMLRGAGGVYLLYLAWSAFREARSSGDREGATLPPPPRTLLEATGVNLLNPNPYLGWTFVLGPAAVAAWRAAPSHAVALIASFYATMTVSLAGFIMACGSARLLSDRVRRALGFASGLALAVLGAWQVVLAVGR